MTAVLLSSTNIKVTVVNLFVYSNGKALGAEYHKIAKIMRNYAISCSHYL